MDFVFVLFFLWFWRLGCWFYIADFVRKRQSVRLPILFLDISFYLNELRHYFGDGKFCICDRHFEFFFTRSCVYGSQLTKTGRCQGWFYCFDAVAALVRHCNYPSAEKVNLIELKAKRLLLLQACCLAVIKPIYQNAFALLAPAWW